MIVLNLLDQVSNVSVLTIPDVGVSSLVTALKLSIALVGLSL